MNRIFTVAAAAAATLALVPAAGHAQGAPRAFFVATAATAPAKPGMLTRGMVWKCAGAVCTANKADARPAIACELVVREVGPLSAFRADGAEFGADALAKCNAKAR